jgi:hypothetical protein
MVVLPVFTLMASGVIGASAATGVGPDFDDQTSQDEDDQPGVDSDTVLTPEYDVNGISPTPEIKQTINTGSTIVFSAQIDAYRIPDANTKIKLNGKTVSTGEVRSEVITRQITFRESGTYRVKLLVEDSNSEQMEQESWKVVAHPFNSQPRFSQQSSTQILELDEEVNIATFTVENPSVNERNIVAGISATLPDGMSIKSTKGATSGSAAIQTTSDLTQPGEVNSMRLVLTTSDESLVGENVTIDYRTRYYAKGDTNVIYTDQKRSNRIKIVRPSPERPSGEAGSGVKLNISSISIVIIAILSLTIGYLAIRR